MERRHPVAAEVFAATISIGIGWGHVYNSIEQTPSWEAHCCSAGQEIPYFS